MKYACCKSSTGGASDTLKCNKCCKHYHIQCLYPTNENKGAAHDVKKTWICPDCISSQPRVINNDNTPIRGQNLGSGNSDNINLRRGAASISAPSSVSSLDKSLDLGESSPLLEHVRYIIRSEISNFRTDINASIAGIQNEIRSVREEFSSIKVSLEYINNIFEDFGKRLSKCEVDVKQLSKSYSEVVGIKTSLESMEMEHNNRDQWARRSNIEIQGVPQTQNENLFNVVQNIAKKIDCTLVDTDIDFVTRVASKSNDGIKPKHIVARFLSRWKKDDFLARARKIELKCSDIDFRDNDSRIYCNDHLTSANKSLLQEAKKIAKVKDYKYVWVRNCCIMVRRLDKAPVIHITKPNDLKKIV